MILVTGGNGVIGRRLAAEFRKRSEFVRILALPDSKVDAHLAELGVEIVHGDVTQAADLEKACKGISTVYHLAALLSAPENPAQYDKVNTEGTRTLLHAAEKSGVGHFIFVSSISVTYPRLNPYSRSKLEAESLVQKSNLPWTLIRPCLVLDGLGGGDEFRIFAEFFIKHPYFRLPESGKARKRPIHVDDLVSALAAINGNPVTYGKTYALGGLDKLPLSKLTASNTKGFIPIPTAILRIIAGLNQTGSRLLGRRISRITHQSIDGLVFDAAPEFKEAQEDLNWSPRSLRDFHP